MAQVLILFATREGQTAKVAERIAAHLQDAGVGVRLLNARDIAATRELALEDFDLLAFGGSMHAGGIEKELVEFINANSDRIRPMTRSFFLVLLSAATRDAELRAEWLTDARTKLTSQIHVEFTDLEMIGGALAYSRYSRPIRLLMKRIAKQAGESTDTSRDHEYTDWAQVARYAQRLINQIGL